MNYYKILEVDQNSDINKIKLAYRKLAKKYHPDKGGNVDKFKEINSAYSTLSDPDKKKLYDLNNGNFENEVLFGSIFSNLKPFFPDIDFKIYTWEMNEQNIQNINQGLEKIKKTFNTFKKSYSNHCEKEIKKNYAFLKKKHKLNTQTQAYKNSHPQNNFNNSYNSSNNSNNSNKKEEADCDYNDNSENSESEYSDNECNCLSAIFLYDNNAFISCPALHLLDKYDDKQILSNNTYYTYDENLDHYYNLEANIEDIYNCKYKKKKVKVTNSDQSEQTHILIIPLFLSQIVYEFKGIIDYDNNLYGNIIVNIIVKKQNNTTFYIENSELHHKNINVNLNQIYNGFTFNFTHLDGKNHQIHFKHSDLISYIRCDDINKKIIKSNITISNLGLVNTRKTNINNLSSVYRNNLLIKLNICLD